MRKKATTASTANIKIDVDWKPKLERCLSFRKTCVHVKYRFT